MASPFRPPHPASDFPKVQKLFEWLWQQVGVLTDAVKRDPRFSDDRVSSGARTQSSVVYWNDVPAPTPLQCLIADDNQHATWQDCPGASSGGGTAFLHAILSPTHSDAVTASVVRGDIVKGNSTPKWDRLAIGASGKFLRSNGADPSWQLIVEADIVDGTLLARVGSAETITGAWLFTTPPQFGDAGTVGQIKFGDGNTAFLSTFSQLLLSANRTIYIPDVTGTITVGVGTSVNAVNQSGDIAATALLANGHPAGNYMASVVLEDTTADALSTGVVTATVGWTDDAGAATDGPPTLVLTALGRQSKLVVFYSTGAASITYATSHTGVIGATAKYGLRIRLEYLG